MKEIMHSSITNYITVDEDCEIEIYKDDEKLFISFRSSTYDSERITSFSTNISISNNVKNKFLEEIINCIKGDEDDN